MTQELFMCGFIAYTGSNKKIKDLIKKNSHKISHRGPDNSQIVDLHENGILVFHRLMIMDLSKKGDQPFDTPRVSLMCNGEIYNYKQIEGKYKFEYNSDSDCERIIPLYLEKGIELTAKELDAEFALVLFDKKERKFKAARDPLGVRPLFYGKIGKNYLFSSEAKGIAHICKKVKPFPPGAYFDGQRIKHYTQIWRAPSHKDSLSKIYENIRNKLTAAVNKRLASDAPIGFLLSGGLDSSLVCSIAANTLSQTITTFAIGIEDGPIDTKYARKVAAFIKSEHHEVLFKKSQIFETLPKLIELLETYDITTIRASIGMFLLCKYIKENTNIKVLLTGEVSDELFGYKYTDFAPSGREFQKEAVKRIKELYMYDLLRADRCIAGASLEARVPFGDIDFVSYVMGINPKLKMNSSGMGKLLLRKAFDDGSFLPHDILYREKAAFSDAVGHAMVDCIKEHAEKLYSKDEFSKKIKKYPHAPPPSKEALMYREIFESFYPGKSYLIKDFWLPNKQWTNCDVLDPSARMLPNYGGSGE